MAVENTLASVTDPISSLLKRIKLRYHSFSDVTGYCRYGPDLFTVVVLKVPMMSGGDLYFLKKNEAKRFPKEASLLQQGVPCISSRVVKISIPIGSHKPLWRNYPEDISLPFQWPHESYPPTLKFDLLSNQIFIRHPQ